MISTSDIIAAVTIAGKGNRKASWSDFTRAFFARHAAEAFLPTIQQDLWSAVEEAASQGVIQLPAVKGQLWTGAGRHRRPHYLMLPKAETEVFVDRHPWHPDLLFAINEKPGNRRDLLLQVDNWIRNKRSNSISVPIRERAIEISGDEKSLDLVASRFFGGQLAIEKLNCHYAPLPISIEAGRNPGGKPIIILENADSFASFAAWNRATDRLAGVAYGAGGQFRGSAHGNAYLDQFIERHGASAILYLGDIDTQGIEIPARANQARVAAGKMPIEPARDLYAWLLNHGRPAAGPQNTPLSEEALAWIAPYGKLVNHLISQNLRLAQEWLGTQALRTDLKDWVPGSQSS